MSLETLVRPHGTEDRVPVRENRSDCGGGPNRCSEYGLAWVKRSSLIVLNGTYDFYHMNPV